MRKLREKGTHKSQENLKAILLNISWKSLMRSPRDLLGEVKETQTWEVWCVILEKLYQKKLVSLIPKALEFVQHKFANILCEEKEEEIRDDTDMCAPESNLTQISASSQQNVDSIVETERMLINPDESWQKKEYPNLKPIHF